MKISLTKNAGFNLIYSVLNVIFPLLSASYVSRVLSPAGVGKVAYAQNIASYFVMIAAVGLTQYGIREAARAKEDMCRTSRLMSEMAILNGFSSLICAGAYLVFIYAVFPQEKLIYLIFGAEIVLGIFGTDWLYQGREEYRFITLKSFFVKIVSFTALLIFVKTAGDHIEYALILCLGIFIDRAVGIVYALTKAKPSFRGISLRHHIKPVVIFTLSAAISGLYGKTDITILGIMASESDVGFYTVAHKTVIIVTALGTALTAVFLPRLSFIYQRDKSKYSEIISLGTKIALLLTVPACLGLIAVSDGAVVLLFGKAFEPAAVTLRILAVLTVIKGVGDVLCYQPIVSSGNERILIISGIAAGAANIILSFILIPICSYNGAAIALVASELVVNGVLLSRALKIARPKLSFKFLLSLVLSNACMILAVLLVRAAVSQPAASFALSVAAGVLVYCISLMLTKNEMVKELFKKLKKES